MSAYNHRRTRVLYDGHCAFCKRSVTLLQRLDWLGKLEYVDARDTSLPLLSEPLVAGAPLLDQMHVLTPRGRLYGGYHAIRAIAWRLPLTWLVAPFLYLPGVTWLGQKLYVWVARNRFNLVPCEHGACQIKRPAAR